MPAYLRHYYYRAHGMAYSLTKKFRFNEHSLHSFSAVCPRILVKRAYNNNRSNIQKIFLSVRPKARRRTRKNINTDNNKAFCVTRKRKKERQLQRLLRYMHQVVKPIINFFYDVSTINFTRLAALLLI